MMPENKAIVYQVYLLRLWKESHQPDHWRFMLQEAGGQRRHWSFDTLEDLTRFLQRMTASGRPDGSSSTSRRS